MRMITLGTGHGNFTGTRYKSATLFGIAGRLYLLSLIIGLLLYAKSILII